MHLITSLSQSLQRRDPIWGLLLLTLVRGVLYSFITPPWQGPDEPSHFHYLVALNVDGRLFPDRVQVLPDLYKAIWENATEYRIWDYNQWTDRTVVSPPSPDETQLARAGGLYYRILYPLYALTVGWSLDGQLFAIRMGSASLTLLTVAATYGIARAIYRGDGVEDRLISVVAAACVAFQPMYGFVAASINDDNLVPPLATLTALGVVRGLRCLEELQPGWRWWLLAVFSAVGAVMTKRTGITAFETLGVGLLAVAFIWIRRGNPWQRKTAWLTVTSFGLMALLVVLLLIYQPVLPPELTWRFQLPEGILADLGEAITHSATRHWTDWYTQLLFLTLSFWGWFGWLKAPLGLTAISILRSFSLIVTVGFLIQMLVWALAARSSEARWRLGLITVLALSACGNAILLLAQHLANSETYFLVGRYLFPSLASWAILTVIGWRVWWPPKWAATALTGIAVLGAVLDIYAWLFVMIPFFYA